MNTEFFTKPIQKRAHLVLRWQTWLYSLLAGTILGGVNALANVGGFSIAHASGLNVRVLNWTEIKATFISGALTSVIAYLLKSPLPPLVEDANGDTPVEPPKT